MHEGDLILGLQPDCPNSQGQHPVFEGNTTDHRYEEAMKQGEIDMLDNVWK